MSYFLAFLSSLPFNWIDILILIVIFFYSLEGYSLGFYYSFLDLISFVLAFIFGLSFYSFFAKILIKLFTTPQGFAKALGFFIAAFLTEIIASWILKTFIEKTPFFRRIARPTTYKILNGILGIIPSILSAFLLLAFILTMVMVLPVSSYLKKEVSSSIIGNELVANTQGLGKNISNVFGGAVSEGLTFFTVEPESNESVNLNFKTNQISIDSAGEKQMFNMVNQEREQRGIQKLVTDQSLINVARAHCEDMFKRGYFSHNTPEGLTPFDRMGKADIEFTFAGENLALAPNTGLAMQGLMQSPGHRENILSKNFGKIGVGVIDGGIYGEMFTQEFTD